MFISSFINIDINMCMCACFSPTKCKKIIFFCIQNSLLYILFSIRHKRGNIRRVVFFFSFSDYCFFACIQSAIARNLKKKIRNFKRNILLSISIDLTMKFGTFHWRYRNTAGANQREKNNMTRIFIYICHVYVCISHMQNFQNPQKNCYYFGTFGPYVFLFFLFRLNVFKMLFLLESNMIQMNTHIYFHDISIILWTKYFFYQNNTHTYTYWTRVAAKILCYFC